MRAGIAIAAVAAALMARGGAAAPDEALVAFAGVHWSTSLQTSGSQLYVVRGDGSGLRRVTRPGAAEDMDPAWSPDGGRLAFGRRDSRGWRLYVMRADGTRLRSLTTTRPLADSPNWSPDGRAIAFAGLPANLPAAGSIAQQIYVVPSTGGRPRQLTSFAAFRGGAGGPAWSPDAKRLLFWATRSPADHARTDVWIARANGSGARRLLANATDPAWSPDGRRIAFVRAGDLYTASADGSTVRRLTHTASAESDPSWCPDGLRIAFAGLRRAGDPARDTQRIFVIGADGAELRAVTKADPRFWAGAPAWQPAAAR